MGRFFGALHTEKGFFGPEQPAPAVCQFLIQAGGPAGFPGSSGIDNPVGWFGLNDGTPGPSTVGAIVSGQALFDPGGFFGFGDSPQQIRIPFAGPSFLVYSGVVFNKGDFVSVNINGTTYATATVPYFDNLGGCGPTYWIWEGQPAGLVSGQQYCTTWVMP